MPEIPDLENTREVLSRKIIGLRIDAVEVPRSIVVRLPAEEFRRRLEGVRFTGLSRYGKFLQFALDSGDLLVVNAMLTGRFQYVEAPAKRRQRTCYVLGLGNGRELRYVDQRLMGKTYLVPADQLATVPQFDSMGPDALDAELTEAVFLERLRRYRGQVKNVLINHKFVAGIGNAYSDEILFVAGLHPFTKLAALDEAQRGRLYRAMHEVYDWAIPIVREAMGGEIDGKPRDFLRIHRKGGEPCPSCGATITEVAPNRRVTSFCRACQPGLTAAR